MSHLAGDLYPSSQQEWMHCERAARTGARPEGSGAGESRVRWRMGGGGRGRESDDEGKENNTLSITAHTVTGSRPDTRVEITAIYQLSIPN